MAQFCRWGNLWLDVGRSACTPIRMTLRGLSLPVLLFGGRIQARLLYSFNKVKGRGVRPIASRAVAISGPGKMAVLTVIMPFKRSQFRKEPHSEIREQRILSILRVLHAQRMAFGT